MLSRNKIDEGVKKAVMAFWQSRINAAQKQRAKGVIDTGNRSEVTGGKNLDGFVELIEAIIKASGVAGANLAVNEKNKTLPGFYRPTKDWDVVITVEGKLVGVLEFKSQVGPSFGNNFNNRAEEAVGNAEDFWTAYRDGLMGKIVKPFLGYCYLMEDCDESARPVGGKHSLYTIAAEFRGASRQRMLELLCRKLVRERKYDAAAALVSKRTDGIYGDYRELADDVGVVALFMALQARLASQK